MFLSRFGVKNYKCLGDIDIPLTPLHVLIGQNDSGKTSLLEAVVALYGSLQEPPERLFPKPWQGRQLVCLSATEPMIELRGQWLSQRPGDEIGYGLSVRFTNSGHECLVEQRWLNPSVKELQVAPDRNERFPLTLPLPVKVETSRYPAYAALADIPDHAREPKHRQFNERRERGLTRLKQFLKPVEKYSLDPRAMKLPAAARPAAEIPPGPRRFRTGDPPR